MPMQTWGADLSELDFDDIVYYQKPSDKPARNWDDVPDKIKETFERIGIPEAERTYLAGASAQYESGSSHHNMKEEYDKHGIIFTDTDTALKEHLNSSKYFGKLVPPSDNKLARMCCFGVRLCSSGSVYLLCLLLAASAYSICV